MNDMNTWVTLARNQKMKWVEKSERGDIPPTILAEKDGQLIATIVAPVIDKNYALHACNIMRVAAGCDAFTLILDAHIQLAGLDETIPNYKPGDMQRACDQEGACEAGIISDCIICQHIIQDGRMKMTTMPYTYHGKGSEFKWKDNDTFILDENDGPGHKVEGNIAYSLREIMKKSAFLDGTSKEGETAKVMADMMHLSSKRRLYHSIKAALRVLDLQGYDVIDHVTLDMAVALETEEKE